MSEQKYTKGPWELVDKFGRQVIKAAHGQTVVIIENWTREEDARLIAAAPDLLEALEGLLNAPYKLDALCGGSEQMAAVERARAALHKAKATP